MMTTFLQLVFLFVPAFVANATPVIIKNIPPFSQWNQPISARIFGKNKTWRGLVSGTLMAILVAWLQFLFFPSWYPLEITLQKALLIGFLLGIGALIGDFVESAIKRKLGKKPGAPLPFWDGTDYIFGALIVLSPIYVPTVLGIILLILLAPFLSLIANTISYLLGWKNVWW